VSFSTNLSNTTSFSGLFNVNYGFVQMVFNNIDRSIIVLELIRIDKWEKFEFKDNSEFHNQIYPNKK